MHASGACTPLTVVRILLIALRRALSKSPATTPGSAQFVIGRPHCMRLRAVRKPAGEEMPPTMKCGLRPNDWRGWSKSVGRVPAAGAAGQPPDLTLQHEKISRQHVAHGAHSDTRSERGPLTHHPPSRISAACLTAHSRHRPSRQPTCACAHVRSCALSIAHGTELG